ncbi:hypothetical protein [Chroococcidiopsis sp. CCMEE 29]|uniref:hypothetical protein n=1 Tax=Chroococcidiopsis sp. CCMEE 29 TaxID=155894 RepID=UPI00202231BF|nr:hypothetical protein [Chroococcidiopsis sp. CCMEE 29]
MPVHTACSVELSCRQPEGYSRWFLFRRCPEHPDDPSFISYYQVFAPSNTSVETMVGVAGQRWRIEEYFQFACIPTRLRRLRSSFMDGLASPRHFGPGGRSFLVCAALSSRTAGRTFNSSIFFSSRRGWQSGCVQSGPWALVCLSLAELRRWLWRFLLPRSWSLESILHWSFWRRHHQALARYHHYRKRSQAP